MAKENQLTVELSSGNKRLAIAQRYYLPANSNAIDYFRDTVSIFIKPTIRSESHFKPTSHAMKIFVGDTPKWQDSQPIIDAFGQLWVEILRFVAGLSNTTVELVYFSGQATKSEIFSLWPYLPFDFRNDKRFYLSEVRKLTKTLDTASIWLCVEYFYDDFKRMTGPDGFKYSYGTTIMGISTVEDKVDTYLQKNLLDKSVLKEVIKDKDVRCWWFCDSDFEGMTICHKDYSSDDLLGRLQNEIKGQVEGMRGQILIC
ncbi:MAG: hypothetical protein FVQ84_21850 [Planctomycetes bacterium]|nr:hypothetical protein [Planctomycetota bacterium]